MVNHRASKSVYPNAASGYVVQRLCPVPQCEGAMTVVAQNSHQPSETFKQPVLTDTQTKGLSRCETLLISLEGDARNGARRKSDTWNNMKTTASDLSWPLLSIFAITTIIAGTGCGTLQLPPFQPQAAASYPVHQGQNGLIVAMKTMCDPTENKRYFGVDLLAAKILPILVVITNESNSDSFLILREKCAILDMNASGSAESTGLGGTKTAQVLGGVAVLAGAAGSALLIPMIPLAAKMGSDSVIIKHNLVVNELQTHTLEPGKSTFGFLYVPLPKKGPFPNPIKLQLETQVYPEDATVLFTCID